MGGLAAGGRTGSRLPGPGTPAGKEAPNPLLQRPGAALGCPLGLGACAIACGQTCPVFTPTLPSARGEAREGGSEAGRLEPWEEKFYLSRQGIVAGCHREEQGEGDESPGPRRGPRAARGERAQEGPEVAQSTSQPGLQVRTWSNLRACPGTAGSSNRRVAAWTGRSLSKGCGLRETEEHAVKWYIEGVV